MYPKNKIPQSEFAVEFYLVYCLNEQINSYLSDNQKPKMEYIE